MVVIAISTAVHGPSLSDGNRHLSQHLVPSGTWAALAMAPVYSFAGLSIWHLVGRQREVLWWLVFAVSASLALVVVPHVEPTRFVIPMLIMRSAVAPPSAPFGTATLISHLLIDSALDLAILWAFLSNGFIL
jgi:hypothetical protein